MNTRTQHGNIRRQTILPIIMMGMVLVPSMLVPGKGVAAEPETVVIGYENLGATPEMVVITKGWFQKHMGGHVVLKEFSSGPAALTALASGALQFMTEIGNPPVAAAINRGIELDVIWNNETFTTGEGLVVRNQSGIKSLADLVGKRVAVVAGSSSDYVLTSALAKAGVDRSKIHLINVAPPGMLSAWEGGSIDAAFVWTPVLDQLAVHGGKVVFTDGNAVAYAPSVNLSVVNRAWAKSHPEQVAQFLRAQNQGVEYTRSHPEDALKTMAKGAGISEAQARVELSGIQIFDAREQLTEACLGASGQPTAASSVGRGLDSALHFLRDAGLAPDTHSVAPSSSIQRAYVEKIK